MVPSPVKAPRVNQPKLVSQANPTASLANRAASQANPARARGAVRNDEEIMEATPVTIRVEELDRTIGVIVILDPKPVKAPRTKAAINYQPSPARTANPARARGAVRNDEEIMAAIPVTTRVEELDRTIGVIVILDHQSARNGANETLDRARETIDCTIERNKVDARDRGK